MALETSADSPAPVRVISQVLGEYLGRLGSVWIEGEVAEINLRSGAGLAFIRLKDPSSDISLSVTAPRSVIEAASPLPPNARIVIQARASWYAKRGDISFAAREIRQVGIGELLARLEHLKSLLAAEGLFAMERKHPLPFLPRRIGLICGRASAAMKDVVENAKRRWPSVAFEIREVAVQGSSAVSEVVAALRELDSNDEVDVIIITRGGGSFEDLLPFSDEGLVRAVAAASTPIVSAIGHEQDQPLLDLVADVRASTPTDAAKRTVPDVREERELITRQHSRSHRAITGLIERETQRLLALSSRPVLAMPQTMITTRESEITALAQRSSRVIFNRLEQGVTDITHVHARLRSLSPQSTLDRGYAVVQRSDGSVLRSPEGLEQGEALRIRVSGGRVDVEVSAHRVEP
jgi:exodeoxyribonuclease VII large subunit